MRRRCDTEGDAHHLLVHRRLEKGVGALGLGDRFRHGYVEFVTRVKRRLLAPDRAPRRQCATRLRHLWRCGIAICDGRRLKRGATVQNSQRFQAKLDQPSKI